MSTKCTIKHGDDFHLYSDIMDQYDEDNAAEPPIYLELRGVEFEASNHCITVAIPSHIAILLGLSGAAARAERKK